MIKRMLFLTIALFSVFQVIAKTSPDKNPPENEPQDEVRLHAARVEQHDEDIKVKEKKARPQSHANEEAP